MDTVPDARVIGDVLVDGELVRASDAAVSVLDIGLQRGFGCFEALRSYGGKPFRLRAHGDRLAASARRLGIALPERDVLEEWIVAVSRAAGDCVVRILVTGGIDPFVPGSGSRVVVLAEPLPEPGGPLRVLPLDAPWHADGAVSELTGAKTLSYGPNLAATLEARRRGYDDALLIGGSGSVLEGPTYGIAWVNDGVVSTPGLDLCILESITRTAMLDVAAAAGVRVVEGRYSLDTLLGSDEVFAMSTVKELKAVTLVGEHRFDPGPLTSRLAAGYRNLVREELAAA